MRILHLVPGVDDVANGMAVAARLIAREQGDAEVADLNREIRKIHEKDVEEVWVHGMWLPNEWRACMSALRTGKRLVRMTHGSLSPLYLRCQSPVKKRIVSPIERYLLRKADRVVATCEAEAGWIRRYEPGVKAIEVTDVKRFFRLNHETHEMRERDGSRPLHLLYLGRRHPLKGVEYLEEAVARANAVCRLPSAATLRVISDAFGEEKEKIWDWCDVLVLPTLSENFGLVVAEALERGKRVIVTDGAPAWSEGVRDCGGEGVGKCRIGIGYGGRLQYLRGYCDGSAEDRVRLIRAAICNLV